MLIKRFYDPISMDGKVLDREEVLSGPEAKGAEAEVRARDFPSEPNRMIGSPLIFKELIRRGVIKELRPRDRVRLSKLPRSGIQHMSPSLVEGGIAEGWMKKLDDKITIQTVEGDDVAFTITQTPGRYCLYDGVRIEGIKGDGQPSRDYIAEHFPDEKSPYPDWPNGYSVQHYYNCELEG